MGEILESVEDAVDVFGRNKVGVHLIVGLGETEKEMIKVVQQAHGMGAKTHLFSFYPVTPLRTQCLIINVSHQCMHIMLGGLPALCTGLTDLQ